MKIYNGAGVEIYDVVVDDKSYSYRSLLEISSLTLYFSSPEFIDIPLGAYCEFQGATFYLENPSNFKKNGTRNFEYTLILEESWARSRRYKLKNIADGRLKFSLTAKPNDHIKLIVDNMNLRDSGWTVGDCVDSSEKTISYNHIYCKDALQMVADEFQTEWEIVGKVIHLRKIEYYKDAPLTLSYGKGNGFKTGLGRTNLNDSRPVEVLYVQGGERNIDYSKYGARELLLPKSQQLVYQGRTYESDASGLSIYRADKPVQFNNEDSLDLSHIYPSRVGTVSSVIVVDADKHFYDFIDVSIPADLDYNDCRIAGEKAVVIFQSGILAGREFEIEQTEDAITGYVHAERRFKLVPQEMDGVTMPDATFKPAAGDKYAVFGISLPDAYVCDNANQEGGSWDMFREAAKYLFENEDLKFSFTGELDGIWAKQNWLVIGGKIKPGGFVSFSDTQFQTDGILIRQISTKQFVNNPYSPVVELSNAPAPSGIGSTLKKISVNEVVAENMNKEAIRYAKRGFRDTKQTAEMLANAMVYYGKAINPVTIQTMALMVGDESLQFRFVDDKTTPVAVAHNVQFDSTTKVLNSPAGIIQHMTLGIDSLSSSHAISEYKFWDLTAYDSPAMDQPDKSYYLYAKVSKSAQTGVFLLSEPPIGIEEVTGYYHLLMGILNSENDEGDRSYVDLYGYSELLPGRLTIGKIVSPDGNIVIDLTTGTCELQGVFSFSAGSSGYANMVDKPDLTDYALMGDVDLAVSTANSAASAASAAQTSAAGAISAINNITSDNVLSAAEKPAQRQDWNVVYAEKSGINSQASTFGITTENTAYNNAFQALATYLNNGTTWSSGIPSWLSDAKLSVNTTIVGATYRTNWGNLYSARTTLLNAIAAKAKTLADAAQSTANTANTTANTAQSTANTASANATSALNQLTTIGSDNYLSKNEKPWIKKEYDAIISEQAGIAANAGGRFPDELTAYNNAVNALSVYLNSLSPSYTVFTSDTAIVGATFRANFNNVYSARQALLNKIAEIVTVINKEDILQYYSFDEVSGLTAFDHINSRNLNYAESRTTVDGVISKAINIAANGTGFAIGSMLITSSFSAAFWLNSPASTWPNTSSIISSSGVNGFRINTASGSRTLTFIIYDSSGVMRTITSYTPDTIQGWSHYCFTYNQGSGDWFLYQNGIKVLSGTNAYSRGSSTRTFYVGSMTGSYGSGFGGYIDELYMINKALSQSQVRYLCDLRNAQNSERTKTVIDGGMVTTGRIELGDATTIKAGIYGGGTSETDIRIWAGATFANRATAPFRVEQSGKVVSTSGVIGGWNITTDAIYTGTKSTANGFSTSGITLASDGSIHAQRFYVNADGSVGIRSGSATGKRIEIDSTNNNISFYNSSNVLVAKLDDGLVEGYAGLRIYSASSSSNHGSLWDSGLIIYEGGTVKAELIYRLSQTTIMAKNMYSKSDTSGDWKAVHYQPSTGFLYVV